MPYTSSPNSPAPSLPETPWSPLSMRFVHARSVKKANLPRLDPQVESLCQDLLARLDAEQGRQWLKVSAPRAVKATVPAGVVAGARGNS